MVCCLEKTVSDLGIGKVSNDPYNISLNQLPPFPQCLPLFLEHLRQNYGSLHQLTCVRFLDSSSHATARPSYSTTQSQQASQPARPNYTRNASAVSTHSPSGRPHPPLYPAPEPKKAKSRTTLLNRIAAQQSARGPLPTYSNGTATSFNWRSGRPMAGMLEIERSRTRRERTFIGSECAVCEEPLEHTLRGERILQFSCGHVSHEACFYEYIKEFESQYCPTCNAPLGLDTSRGGNVLDLGRLPRSKYATCES